MGGRAYSDHAELFFKAGLDGAMLLAATDENLAELGLSCLHRIKIQLELAKLRRGTRVLFSPWTTKEAAKWLKKMGFDKKKSDFKDHAVDGDLLCCLSNNVLTEDLGFSPTEAEILVGFLRKEGLSREACGALVLKGYSKYLDIYFEDPDIDLSAPDALSKHGVSPTDAKTLL